MTPKGSEDLSVSLRQYAELLVSELGKRTDEKFLSAKEAVGTAMVAAEKAVSAALVASDKLTSAAFIAAKEALKEAQIQLAEYKSSSNEWRATLTDLIAKGMLRPEVEARFLAATEKTEQLASRVSALEKKAEHGAGEASAEEVGREHRYWRTGNAGAIAAIVTGIVLALIGIAALVISLKS
jgi:hypothetical protein